MMRRLGSLLLLLAACSAPSVAPAPPSRPDAGPRPDAGLDAGSDAGLDAGPDAGPDAGFDAGFDAGPDPVPEDAGRRCRAVLQLACNPSPWPAYVCDLPPVGESVESLLMDATGSLVPPEPEIFRGARDVAALRELEPGWSYGPLAQNWAPGLFVWIDEPTRAALDAGTWHGWDCELQAWPAHLQMYSFFPAVFLEPDGLVDSRQLARAWSTQPGVTHSEPNLFGRVASCGYSGGTCVSLDGGDWTWFVSADRRDCSRYGAVFETHEDGSITTLARFDTDGGEALSPDLTARFHACLEQQSQR